MSRRTGNNYTGVRWQFASKPVTSTPLCTVRHCPAKSDPDWHACVVCGAIDIEHHHVENRGMGGSKRDIPVIALCHEHHEKITLNEWSSGVLPDGRIVIWGLHGETIWETAGREELGENDGIREPEGTHRLDTVRGSQSHSRGAREEGCALRESDGWDGNAIPGRTSLQGLSEEGPDFGPDYLELPEEFTLQDAVPWAAMVGKWEHGRQWYAGDLLLACEARFGHERLWGQSLSVNGETFVDLLGMTYQSLRNCQRVCEAFSPGERFPLSFGHHAATYGIADRAQRDSVMEQALAEGWTVSQTRQAVSGHVEPAKHECPLCGAEHRVKEPMT